MTDDTTTLTFDFGRVLSEDEKRTIGGIVDAWEGRQRVIREGFPKQHARHVPKAELAMHYPHCDPKRPARPADEEACKRADHGPLDCRDCGATIVSAAGFQRRLICGRLHGLPLKVDECHPGCVTECGGR